MEDLVFYNVERDLCYESEIKYSWHSLYCSMKALRTNVKKSQLVLEDFREFRSLDHVQLWVRGEPLAKFST